MKGLLTLTPLPPRRMTRQSMFFPSPHLLIGLSTFSGYNSWAMLGYSSFSVMTSPLIQLPFFSNLGPSWGSRTKHDLGNPKNSFSKF
jgi:hypothetical protein